jgi:hypothetical protein
MTELETVIPIAAFLIGSLLAIIYVVPLMRSRRAAKAHTSTDAEEMHLVDLNAGMIQAVTNPPPGFVSKHSFVETDIPARIGSIEWFARCGQPISLDLSMDVVQIASWPKAISSCKGSQWENVELDAQNQLTLWLHLNDPDRYRNWNEIVVGQKNSVLNRLIDEKIIPFQAKQGLDVGLVHSVQWDILGALMENAYLGSGHRAFFFLELLMVYEAGHFPCGWEGEWPRGRLRVY